VLAARSFAPRPRPGRLCSARARHAAPAPPPRAVKLRIRATNNVAKITNVMKMVSSAKLRGIEDALFRGRTFGESMLNAVAADPIAESKKSKDEEGIVGLFSDATKRHLCVLMTTDRGLCGAVNSSLARSLRRELNAAAKAKVNVKLMTLGDKGRALVARDYAPIVCSAIDNLFDKDPIFPLAAAIASKVVAQPYDLLTLYYNHYENQAKYQNTFKQIPQMVRVCVGWV
jgi:F-type H+-transporting ATPase subunit gamma